MQPLLELFARPLAAIARLRAANRQAFNLIVGALVLAAVLLGVFYAFNPGAPEILASNLSPADRTALALMLRRRAIPFTLGTDSISVPARHFEQAEHVLAASPGFAGGSEGFSLFDRAGFGQSDFDQQVDYQRSLQGELERTIMQIRGVDNARVMLAMGRPSPFALGDGDTAHASVMVTTAPGAMLDSSTARAIAHLVANSVRGLSPDNVSVTNQNGAILYPPDHNGEMGEAVQLRNQLELRLQHKVSALLSRIMGKDRYAVEVSVAVDTSRTTSRQEIYGNGHGPTVLSEEHSVSPPGIGQLAMGIPGLTSNLPVPTPAPTPAAANPPNAAGPNARQNKNPAANSTATATDLARKDIVNYRPSSRMVSSVSSPVRIKRISVAAVLDGTYESGHFMPLSAQRLAEIKSLLAAAVGAQPERGDSIDVQSAALSQPYVPPVPNPVTQLRSLFSNPLYLYGAIGVGLLLVLALLWLVVRMIKRLFNRAPAQATLSEQSAAAAQPPILAGEPAWIESSVSTDKPAAPSDAIADLRSRVNKAVERDPDVATEVLRRWLAQVDDHGNGAHHEATADGSGEA